jgi:hypothetical protein
MFRFKIDLYMINGEERRAKLCSTRRYFCWMQARKNGFFGECNRDRPGGLKLVVVVVGTNQGDSMAGLCRF